MHKIYLTEGSSVVACSAVQQTPKTYQQTKYCNVHLLYLQLIQMGLF